MAEINKIVIVGGGSSGWMSASTLIKNFPEKDISVIESPNVPTVGVGESTIGQINGWLNDLDIKDDDWMKDCDASYKLSIKFTNFYKENSGSFHYPFGEPWFTGCVFGYDDWYIKKVFHPETPVQDFAESFFPAVALSEKNKIIENKNDELPGWRFDNDTAYHFDAAKFGAWLRDKYAKPRGIKHIVADVTSVITNDNGVDYLQLSTGEQVTADLFIDCTGFNAILIDKALEVPFKSYSDLLPNDSAWATRVPYQDKETELEPYTNCTAINNGWVWNIPLWSRIGTGYVFSSKYVSDEDALAEFKHYLANERFVKIPQDVIDTLEFKKIKMRVGIHEKVWTKNVCAIGLAAGFIEPLESNGLYTVHEFLRKLVNVLYRGSISGFDKAEFNSMAEGDFRAFAEFVAIHYALSQRSKTKYWQDIQDKEDWKQLDNVGMHGNYGIDDLIAHRGLHGTYNPRNPGGAALIATGMHYYPANKSSLKRRDFIKQMNHEFVRDVFLMWDSNKEFWNRIADESPTLYEHLKGKYGTDTPLA